jgi:hypothetical protein
MFYVLIFHIIHHRDCILCIEIKVILLILAVEKLPKGLIRHHHREKK